MRSKIFTNAIYSIISIVLLGTLFFCLFYFFKEALNIYSKVFIIIGYITFCFGILIDSKKPIWFFGYLIILFSILFIRNKVENNYSNYDYLKDWLPLVFKNKIIFINIIGNIFLYMPFIFYIYFYYNKKVMAFVITIISIIFGECLQFLFSLGVLDLVDILFNIIGIIIFILCYEVWIWVKKRKNEKIANCQV